MMEDMTIAACLKFLYHLTSPHLASQNEPTRPLSGHAGASAKPHI